MAIPLSPLMAAALIQMGGQPLSGGNVSGSAAVRLVRAPGGDTPVLVFQHPRGPVKLLLDTGASSSMVTPDLVARLALTSHPIAAERFRLVGGGKGCADLRPRRARLPPMTLPSAHKVQGELRLAGAEAMVLPTGALPAGIDGVLGAPTLRLLPIRIDPLQQTLRLGSKALSPGDGLQASPAIRPRPRLVRLQWRLGVPLMTIATTIGPVRALADTGAEGTFLSPRLALRLEPLGTPRPLRLVGFCGMQSARGQLVHGLSLPGEPPEPAHAIVIENALFNRLSIEAIVGQGLLRGRTQLWRLDLQPPHLEIL